MKILQVVKIFFVTRFGKGMSFSNDAIADVRNFLGLVSTRKCFILILFTCLVCALHAGLYILKQLYILNSTSYIGFKFVLKVFHEKIIGCHHFELITWSMYVLQNRIQVFYRLVCRLKATLVVHLKYCESSFLQRCTFGENLKTKVHWSLMQSAKHINKHINIDIQVYRIIYRSAFKIPTRKMLIYFYITQLPRHRCCHSCHAQLVTREQSFI